MLSRYPPFLRIVYKDQGFNPGNRPPWRRALKGRICLAPYPNPPPVPPRPPHEHLEDLAGSEELVII